MSVVSSLILFPHYYVFYLPCLTAFTGVYGTEKKHNKYKTNCKGNYDLESVLFGERRSAL